VGEQRVTKDRLRALLVLTLAASAGIHAALVSAHTAEGTQVAALFALSALALAGAALLVDRSDQPSAYALAAVMLGTLLALYAASRLVAVWPLDHAERIDAIGALTKLLEAAGLLLALRLLQDPAGSTRELPARQQGAGP
jgi:hypothetical protein